MIQIRGEESTQVAIELPEDIAEGLRAKWKDLPRHTLEALNLPLQQWNRLLWRHGWRCELF